MPKEWHDRHAANQIADPEKKELALRIVADKKPYFMRYIYPALMKEYNTYITRTEKNSLREFDMTVAELKQIPDEELTDRQREFLYYYDMLMPVGVGDCVMNRICRRFEEELDGYLSKKNRASNFDYRILKSGFEYTQSEYSAILKLYTAFNRRVQNYTVFSQYERISDEEAVSTYFLMKDEFVSECTKICPNRFALCDIVLDMCYNRSATKAFAWDICGDEIIENLLQCHGGAISFPEKDENGDIEYGGDRFTLKTIILEGMDE